ncbi:DUF1501 domain-containing protein [Aeromicrobium stalagmiti]|uniref:DUF1501 domain-containing protein n=1 Tax=Aeromicrobium stalagmiti TaxID=2738988 RepID=UPI001567F33B|nr:DUF1501 domain-containing protein [Aeromicrobium stalagmiti]NRQ49398.1 DUF1501 domain-containing protein [Aeromicrobium stalagmiti]
MIHDDCGCDDYGVSRRSLLKAAGLASMAGVATSMVGDVLTSTVYGAGDANVLVVVSLRGGADGLSMIVPHAEPAYYSARPTTGIERSRLQDADDTFGLHPAFAPLGSLWQQGRLAGLHAVGMATPNRSHFDAMELIEDADPGSSARVGWINRMIAGLAASPDVFDGIQIGSTITPTALAGKAPTLSTVEFGDLALPFRSDAVLKERVRSGLARQYSAYGGQIGAAGVNALALAERAAMIDSTVGDGPQGGAVYPKYSSLGSALRTTAGLIRSKVGVKAVAVDAGGWDHHVDLRWRVDDSIKDLAQCLAAFFLDLGADAGRVTVVTMSEFGRRLQENGSAGVDHGYGNAVLALGAGVKGGQYYSRWPGLGIGKQVDGDLAVTTDYRSVLTEILRSRFPAVDTSKVFPGVSYDPLGFMG